MFEQGRQLDLDVALAECDSERAEAAATRASPRMGDITAMRTARGPGNAVDGQAAN